MIRVIVRTDNAGMAANVGGSVETTFKTFDLELPDLELFLSEQLGTYGQRQVIGIERLAQNTAGDA